MEIKREHLKEIELFRAFKDPEIDELIKKGVIHEFDSYANIIIEGELSWGLYIILAGTVGVQKLNKMSGNYYDVCTLQDGTFFGEMSLIDENPRTATVRALTPTRVFYLSKSDFQSFVSGNTDRTLRFFEKCIRTLVNRLRDLDDKFVVAQNQLWKSVVRGKKGAA